jgi:quercetin dioxygenase-like cupin family protein
MSGIHRRQGDTFRWEDVAAEKYVGPGSADVTKQVLIGPADGAANFTVRYFEIAPGGSSALDTHAHDHGVVILRGRGVVRLGDGRHAIDVGDVVYISPNEVHQFENPGPDSLGFLCVVSARR